MIWKGIKERFERKDDDAQATRRHEGRSAEPSPSGSPPPREALIILAVRNTVLFPGTILPLEIGREHSIKAVHEAVHDERPIGVLLQREPIDDPRPVDMHRVGTIAAVLRYITSPEGSHHVICQGQRRFRIAEFLEGYPYMAARVEPIMEADESAPDIEARMLSLKELAIEALQLIPQAPPGLEDAFDGITSPSLLADLIASFLDIKPEEKQEILETIELRSRLDKVARLLTHRIHVLRLSQDISKQTRGTLDKTQREYILREQLKTIQRELGESDAKTVELEELEEKIEAASMPAEVMEEATRELGRLKRMPDAAAEYTMVRTYLEWLSELPWAVTSEDTLDVAHARQVLDEDHYDLPKVKRRILEFLAVHKLNPQGKSPILCFVGPPGVGKTSLGQSIARAMGRKFLRISLGGVHDEAEVRGHRRTYIGALPGIIIQGVRRVGTRNPVFMLDEMDKLGMGFHGDPSSALLEVLDPEQNFMFRDNYLGVPFDLSKVLFIGTANVLDAIPGPLRDRLEVIELAGYTENEKVEIAKRYLLRRQLEANGLKSGQVEITDEALHAIISNYTREAGVRNVEREIGAVMRHAAVRIAEGEAGETTRIGPDEIPEILGPPRFVNELAMRTSLPGVATGLAWTPVGGSILFIEATRMPGSGKLILTGQLGNVMKESAQAALSLVKARGSLLNLEPELLRKSDIHIHLPAGAIPKDGPSAGVALYVALVSLLTGRTARSDAAMTGEISLRGLVLPVGGIKEKVLAAQSAGITTVLLPARNRKDFDDIPPEVREQMRFVWLEHVDQAVTAAIEDGETLIAQPGSAPAHAAEP